MPITPIKKLIVAEKIDLEKIKKVVLRSSEKKRY